MLQLWKGQIIKQEFVDLDICYLSRNLCLIFGYPGLVLSSLFLSYPRPISLYLQGLHPIVNLPISLLMNYLPMALIELLWNDRCFMYIITLKSQNPLRKLFSASIFQLRAWRLREDAIILTLSKLASGRESHVTQKLFLSMTFPSDSASYLKQLN